VDVVMIALGLAVGSFICRLVFRAKPAKEAIK
jgi:hypothetical protein